MKRLKLVNDNFVYNKQLPVRLPATPVPFFSYPFYRIKNLLVIIITVGCMHTGYAQTTVMQASSDYQKVITERAAKIVNTLGITDSSDYKRTLTEVSNQYLALNTIQQENEAAVNTIKTQPAGKENETAALKNQEEKKMSRVLQLHNEFITLLKKHLTDTQVDGIKDGMTYRVFPITYAAYQDMIPTLSAEQKTQIYNWLKEAREKAMDAESSDKKHAVFGKYKGKINNYLSGAGYDMKKEGEEWQKRLAAQRENKPKQ